MRVSTKDVTIDNITALAIVFILSALFVHFSSDLEIWHQFYLAFILLTVLFSSFASIAVAVLGINQELTTIRVCIFFRGMGMFLFSVGAMMPILSGNYSGMKMLAFLFSGSIVWLSSLMAEERFSLSSQSQ
jgi:hypothetical protein